jgi:hypothetical protein
MNSCIKRLFPGVEDTAHLTTLCQPESASHAVICAYTTAKPGETLAEFTARWEASRIATRSDAVKYCPACLKAFAESEQPWRVDFGPEYAVPPEIQAFVDCGVLVDTSYGNDICPSFEFTKNRDLRIWVDFPDPATREMQGKRFTVTLGEAERDFDNRLLMTDELAPVVALCEMTGSGFEITMKDGNGETVEPRPINELSPKTRSRIVRGLGNHLAILLAEEHLRKMPIQAVEVFDEGKAMTVRLRDILVPVDSLRLYVEAITRRPDKPGWSIEETIANTAIVPEMPPCESFASPVAIVCMPRPSPGDQMSAARGSDSEPDVLDQVMAAVQERRPELTISPERTCFCVHGGLRDFLVSDLNEVWSVQVVDLDGNPIDDPDDPNGGILAYETEVPTDSNDVAAIVEALLSALAQAGAIVEVAQ